MTDYEDRDPWDPMPPRFLKSLADLPNYVQDNREMTIDGRIFVFKIGDWRQAHDTTTTLSGYESEDIEMYGFAILLSENKVLLEVWNDAELNFWSEFDLASRTQVFIKLDELKPYLSKYVPNDRIMEHYLREIEEDYSTDFLELCYVYFESDREKDRIMLESTCKNLSQEESWKKVMELVEGYFKRGDRYSTWRGACVMGLASDLFFKGTKFEPELQSEAFLIRQTVVYMVGENQKSVVRRARMHRQFLTSLYRISDEKLRRSELWEVILSQILPNLRFRPSPVHKEDVTEDLAWVQRKGEELGGVSARVADAFLRGLMKTGLLSRKERKYVKNYIKSRER